MEVHKSNSKHSDPMKNRLFSRAASEAAEFSSDGVMGGKLRRKLN